ncbi:MAG: ParB/RepB/Spo0J family partition protein [Nitrosopumilus sp.]|nr:ParB/RepB/Spo0J family partition protein [Nitrosopumilus sp.]
MEVPELYDIPIEQLEVWEEANVRKRDVLLNIEDLAGNIKKFGVQSPLLVWEKKKNEKYIIFSGQRRYEASKLADLDTIPCLVYKTMTVTQAKVLSFSENMYREDMTMEDKSNATRELFEKFKDMDKVAKEGLAVLLGYSSIAGMGRLT